MDDLCVQYSKRRCPFSRHDLPAFYGVIDMLAILPYYIEIMLQEDTVRDTLLAHFPKLIFDSLFYSASPFCACFDYCGSSGRSDTIALYFCKYTYLCLRIHLITIIFQELSRSCIWLFVDHTTHCSH